MFDAVSTFSTSRLLRISTDLITIFEPLVDSNRQPLRNQSLDILRGIAILLVVLRHYEYPWIFRRIGWSGVDLFFVLSGFLISGLLFSEWRRHGSINLKLFWIRRGFKIYPAFYAFMVFVVVGYAFQGILTRAVFSDLFFMQDYIHPIAEHCWSLAVEEKFYFLLPALLLVLLRFRRSDPFRPIPYIFIALFVGCLALRVHAVLANREWFEITQPAHLRIDSLFAGVTLGYYREFRPAIFRKAGSFPLWILGLALLLPVAFFDLKTWTMLTVGISSAIVGFATLVLWSVGQHWPNWRFFNLIAWIGRYSYSIYLWNFVVRAKIGYPETNWGLLSLPLYIATSIGVGWLMAYLVELPALKLREKYFPVRRV